MLELHTDDTIILSSGDVRHFVLDQWDWSRTFYATNSVYSGSAAAQDSGDEE
jgi:hypothetical protein